MKLEILEKDVPLVPGLCTASGSLEAAGLKVELMGVPINAGLK